MDSCLLTSVDRRWVAVRMMIVVGEAVLLGRTAVRIRVDVVCEVWA